MLFGISRGIIGTPFLPTCLPFTEPHLTCPPCLSSGTAAIATVRAFSSTTIFRMVRHSPKVSFHYFGASRNQYLPTYILLQDNSVSNNAGGELYVTVHYSITRFERMSQPPAFTASSRAHLSQLGTRSLPTPRIIRAISRVCYLLSSRHTSQIRRCSGIPGDTLSGSLPPPTRIDNDVPDAPNSAIQLCISGHPARRTVNPAPSLFRTTRC